MRTKAALTMAAIVMVATSTYVAGPTPEAKKAFMQLPVTYVSFEITQAGSEEFSAPKGSLRDGAYRINKGWKFELPLDMPLPDSCPSGTPMEEAMEQGRCMGWTFNIPDDPSAAEQLTSGKLDLGKSPMFIPSQYSVDDVVQGRYRENPSDPWPIGTTTWKGRGVTYVGKSGMLLCDFKKMMCDLSNVQFGSNGGDLVTITTTSETPDFQPQTNTQEASLLLPRIPDEITHKMTGFPLTLPGPSTLTFSGPGEVQGITGRPVVTLKMTVSSKPAAKAGTPSK